MTGLPWQMLASIVMRSRRLIAEFKIMDVGCQERGVNLCKGGFEVGILGRGGISETAQLSDWARRIERRRWRLRPDSGRGRDADVPWGGVF